MLPGTKNSPSVTLLSTGLNKRNGLNALKIVPYVGLLKSPASPPSGPPAGGACVRPVPGVVNSAPRVLRNTSKGVTGADVVSFAPPPSQLISRRPLPSGPGALPLLGSPSVARNASTVLWIDCAVGPAA